MFDWVKEWGDGMPHFYIPTRDTALRNSIDVSDIQELVKKPTSKFPKYPIFIISKGRWDCSFTALSLDQYNIPYRIVIESEEYNNYLKFFDKEKLLPMPFSNLKQGSIPARNWVWEFSIKEGHKKHWILDDNIRGFGIQKGGRRINSIKNGDFFAICEDFVDRYSNVYMAGIRYRFIHNYVKSPVYLNTRIYSCILLDNSIDYRWRGKYNEDTDLSLRILKDGHPTMLFTWCYCNKVKSETIKGGNTDNLYNETDNRREFAESLKEQHPDVTTVVWKYNRWHHQVDYTKFKYNLPIKK